MVNKKENETGNEPKAEKEIKATKQNLEGDVVNENAEKVEKEIKNEQPILEGSQASAGVNESNLGGADEQLTSLDILWHHAFKELDEWAAHADFRDEVFLKEAMYYVESLKRNQGNIQTVTEQFQKEFVDWEKAAREEFLMSTTSLQHFFPHRSYEEINEQIDKIQRRTMSILNVPFQTVSNFQIMDKYLTIIEQYISIRKKGRLQYLKTIKQAANLVYENQKGFVNLFSKQIKSLMFPFNKYLEKAEEFTKL
ncbi:MAG TPA: hypothetical protein VGI04_07540 [Neobacillus sp.]